MLANTVIRQTARNRAVKLWEVAFAMNISESTMTRMLRRELPAKEKEQLLSVIDELAVKKENAAD